jgi:acyl-coenzyme A thioesterase PaaI-like protein
MVPARIHTNLQDAIHGGTTLGFIDVSLFAASRMFGLIEAGTAVTLDLSTQFIGVGQVDAPLDAEVELLRETRRLIFMRGLVVQGDIKVAAFAGTIRKSVGTGLADG